MGLRADARLIVEVLFGPNVAKVLRYFGVAVGGGGLAADGALRCKHFVMIGGAPLCPGLFHKNVLVLTAMLLDCDD